MIQVRTFSLRSVTAALLLASTPSLLASPPTETHTLRFAASIAGVNLCAADNNVPCGFGTQLLDVDAAIGTLFIGGAAPIVAGGLEIKGSISTADLANRVLGSSALTIRNPTGAPVSATIAVGATGFIGPATGAVTSGSGTFVNAGGATATMTWCNDPTNSQGAETADDCIGAIDTFTFSVPDGAQVESFAHTGGPFAVSDPSPFSMTMLVTFTLPAGGQLISRGQVIEAVDVPAVDCSVATRTLWPANHDLVNVGLTASAHSSTGPVPVTIDVFSNEDDVESTGDGRFSPDATSPPLTLRAERKGSGDGRVYLIRARAKSSGGISGFDCCTVVVPQKLSPDGLSAVLALADPAEAACDSGGRIPAGFVAVGDGSAPGPLQEK
jgi:hypothetical protein